MRRRELEKTLGVGAPALAPRQPRSGLVGRLTRQRLSRASLRVALDATSLIDTRTGVGTFTAELLARLARRPDLDVTAFAVTAGGREAMAAELPAGVAAVRRPMVARPLRWCWRRSDRPPIEWWTGAVDVVHGPNFVVPPARRAAEVVTVHDLTCVRFPELCTHDVLAGARRCCGGPSPGARGCTPCRSSSPPRCVEAFGVDPARVVAVPNGAPRPCRPRRRPAPVGRALAGGERYVLALGTVEPRKDLPTLVRAFDALAGDDPDLRLVLAGPDGWGAEQVTAAIAAARHGDRIVPARVGRRRRPRTALLRRRRGRGLPVALRGLRAAAARGAGRRHARRGHPRRCPARGARRRRRAGPTRRRRRAWPRPSRRCSPTPARAADIVDAGPGAWPRYSWDRTADGVVELYHRAADAR